MGLHHAKPILAYKGRMERHDDAVWLIWSNKWGCWYRADSSGYTNDIARAGLYTREQALQHYDGPHVPRKYRVTEPFPISSIKAHLDMCEREAVREHEARMWNIGRMRAAIAGDPA